MDHAQGQEIDACTSCGNKSASRWLGAAALLTSVSVLALAPSLPVRAAEWTAAQSSDWLTGGNWSTNSVPDTTTDVNIEGPSTAILTGPGVGNAQYLTIGATIDGGLLVQTGGILNSASGSIGYGFTDSSAAIDGAGSEWNVASNLYVGYGGVGRLSVTGGAVVNSFGGSIGEGAISNGYATIQGPGSAWLLGSDLVVSSSGDGSLSISNGGRVESLNGYIGTTLDSSGAVTIDGAGSEWAVTGDAYIAMLGTGSLVLANGGTLSAANLFVAPASDSQGWLIVGGIEGQTPEAPGVLNVPMITFDHGDGHITFNHTSDSYDFSTVISGEGVIDQFAGHTILSAASPDFDGLINARGGIISVNGLTDATGKVDNGGTLGGNGTLNAISVSNGGTLAPGNSIGTLHASGDITFAAHSIFEVEVDAAGNGDSIETNAGIGIDGGTVRVLAAPGTYAASTQYTIATAGTFVDGTFDGVSSNFAFLDPTLSYDLQHVYLTLDLNGTSFADIARTANERAAAGNADKLGAGNPVYDSLLTLTAPQAIDVFDQLSGEVHATEKGALLDQSHFVRDAVLNRAANRPRTFGDAAAPLGYAETPEPAALAATSLPQASTADDGYWLASYGGLSSMLGDGNAAAASAASGGFILGADGRVGGWNFGLLADLGLSALAVPDRNSAATSTDFGLGLYGDTRWAETGFSIGASYTRHAISTSRHAVFPGFDETLTADYGAATTQAFAELSQQFEFSGATLQPFTGIAYVNHHTDGFAETGGSAALSSAANMLDATFTSLGLRGSTAFEAGDGTIATLSGSLAWRHGFGATPVADNGFAGGMPATIAGTHPDNDMALLDAGLSFELAPSARLSVSYAGELGAGSQSHALKVSFGGAF